MSDETTQLTIPGFPNWARQILENEAKLQERSLGAQLRVILIKYAEQLKTAQTERQASTEAQAA